MIYHVGIDLQIIMLSFLNKAFIPGILFVLLDIDKFTYSITGIIGL